MWVKICANTTLHDAQLAAELGADAVGFVFAPSKRQVSAAQVAAITPHLPGSVDRVGVFLPSQAAEIAATVRTAGLTAVQIHGEPPPGLLDDLSAAFEGRLKLIQVVMVESSPDQHAAAESTLVNQLQAAFARPALWAVLLDAASGGTSGGLGVSFGWPQTAGLVARIKAESPAASGARVLIAGGLRAGNVAQAMAAFVPFGVDVASGVEEQPGIKSPARLRDFFAAVRGSGAHHISPRP